MASSSSSAPARSIVSAKLYHVFISHRGPDVKETLAKQLYDLLRARECKTFLDREEIEGGDSITSAIRNAICSSRVQIAIFSKGYAESSWCLDELVLMLQQTDALFIPVFYGVHPWELRHIDTKKGKKKKKKRSQYTAAFSDYQRKCRNLDKLDEWKKALASAADISGYEHSIHKDNLCEKIVSRVVEVVQEKEQSIPLHVAKYPTGLDELVQDFERHCSTAAGMVGIFGLGGSGKTTLARELFNRKRSMYGASCFLSDVRESYARSELHSLQNKLFKDLFYEDRKFSDTAEGIGQLDNYVRRAKLLHFLIVLDDIDHREQLDALLPENILGSGSLVIITTRDQSVLRGTDFLYKMKGMVKDHAKDLFCSHAFRRHNPPATYEKLVESFVEFCGGLPLSLMVLGAHVYGRDEYYWELELEKVKKIQPKDIMQRLRISFDGLDREEKQIFIDIACFFNKKDVENMKSKAITIWKASRWSAELAVQTLQDKCLLELVEHYPKFIGDGRYQYFEMHDHLRDLGRQMADELGPPRLWQPVLLRSMEAKGFEQILAETKGRCFHMFSDSSLQRPITYFIADTDLLYLQIDWDSKSIKNIPSWIPLRNLYYLSISRVEELWSSFQQQLLTNAQASFELRELYIFDSPSLQKLPDLIKMFSHLEVLGIHYSLEKTDVASLVQSFKQLSNLRWLKLESGFRQDRANISKLLISRDICPQLQSLEVNGMKNLEELDLKQLDKLKTLVVYACSKLETISGLSTLSELRVLVIYACSELQSVQGLEELSRLKSLLILLMPDDGCGWVRNCIYGLRRLPLVKTILTRCAVDDSSSKLNGELFSEVIGAQAVSEVRSETSVTLYMRPSSSAITISVLLVSPGSYDEHQALESEIDFHLWPTRNFLITVFLTQHDSEVILRRITILKGFEATVRVGEEEKALTILRRIVDRLYT